jgi:hypothetical protein
MSLAAELACAARALSAAGERLHLADAVLVEEWSRVEEAVDDALGERSAELWVLEWRRTLEERLANSEPSRGGRQ